MKHITILLTTIVLICQSTKPMHKQQQDEQKATLAIYHYLNALPIEWRKYNRAEELIGSKKSILAKKSRINFESTRDTNRIEFFLPTSPNYVHFDMQQNNSDNPFSFLDNIIHYGDSIRIKDNHKSIIIFNETTGKIVSTLPKENSSFHIGQRTLGEHPKKQILIVNMNLPLVLITRKAYRRPIETVKNSKLLRSISQTLKEKEFGSLVTYSTADLPTMVDSFLTLEVDKALQRIKIRAFSDQIQDQDTLYIQQTNDGYIILFKVVNGTEYLLARICTSAVHTKIA